MVFGDNSGVRGMVRRLEAKEKAEKVQRGNKNAPNPLPRREVNLEHARGQFEGALKGPVSKAIYYGVVNVDEDLRKELAVEAAGGCRSAQSSTVMEKARKRLDREKADAAKDKEQLVELRVEHDDLMRKHDQVRSDNERLQDKCDGYVRSLQVLRVENGDLRDRNTKHRENITMLAQFIARM